LAIVFTLCLTLPRRVRTGVFVSTISRPPSPDRRLVFGEDKINRLAKFAIAVIPPGDAFAKIIEISDRLVTPRSIARDQALVVAVASLVVNGVSASLLISASHYHEHVGA
jgi:Co/Zn/Cd efflux system component